jgi:hypothetical protein
MTNHEEFKDGVPDREPTPEEETAAERALSGVDVDTVAAEYEHMTDLGAHVRGEGQIESDPA